MIRTWMALAAALVGIQQFASRYAAVSDTVSYLEIADKLRQGDWHAAVNGLWSPLYPAVLAVVTGIFRPSPWWEFPVVHFADFVISLATLAAFAFFLRTVKRESGIAWLVFAWANIVLIAAVSAPDTLVASIVFLAFALILRKRTILLGVVLALGYYAKAPLFPMAFVFLVIAAIVWRDRKRTALAAAVFLVLSCPLLVAMSRATGHPTFGESGRFNYLWHVNGNRCIPTDGVVRTPVIEGVTNAFYYDPTPFCAGEKIGLSLKRQLAYSAKLTGQFFFQSNFAQMIGLLSLLALVAWQPRVIRENWPSVVPLVVAFLMYAGVNLEWRYLMPFIAVALVSVLPDSPEAKRAIGAVLLFAVIVVLARGVFIPARPVQQEVALELIRLGLRPGDRVGTVIGGADNYWERFARVHVVAAVVPEHAAEFWARPDLESFRLSGARAIIVSQVPSFADTRRDWIPLGHGYFLRWLAMSQSHLDQQPLHNLVDQAKT